MTDPITDMLNRIQSAEAVAKPEVVMPHSNLKEAIANILAKEGFVGEVKKVAKGKAKALKIQLKYDQGLPALSGAKRISKPGQRIYQKAAELKQVHGGFGISVVSTPKGLMTGVQARKQNLGGEVICNVW